MRTSQERDVIFLDFEICSNPSYAGKPTFLYFAQRVQELVDDGCSDYWNKNRNNKTYIRKMELDAPNNCVKFLICFNDSTIPSIPVADIDTDEQKNRKLTEREGEPHTAHLIVKTESIPTNHHIYTGLLEEAPHLKRREIEKYFNYLFRLIRQKYPHEFMQDSIDGSVDVSGEPRKEGYTNFFDIQGKLSKDFQQMLHDGKIRALTLVSDQVATLGCANGSSIQPKRRELTLTALSGKLSLIANALTEACHIGKKLDYEGLRISFSNGQNLTSSVMINTNTQNVIGDGFTRKERLGDFSLPLIEAEEDFNTEIVNKMLALL